MKTMPLLFRCPSNVRLPSVSDAWNRTFALSGLLAALLAAPVFADDMTDVTKLLRAGQVAEALGKADGFLAKHPRDAQMRFLKGVILTEQNKAAEAIAIFTKLTEDFPDLPEPYNNLAVLYASNGQYDKARAALDTAIRTNPAYATAYENLGDVHAKLASQAYDKALQLDSANSAAKSKLTLLRTLAGNGAKTTASVVAAAAVPAAGAGAKAASAPPAVVVAEPAKPVAPAAAGQKVASASIPAAAPKPAAAAPAAAVKAEPAKPEAKPATKPAPNATSGDAERDDIVSAVHAWAKAWSAQDTKSYLSFYGSDFQAPKGLSRKAWEEERRSRIEGKGRITVKVDAPQVSVKGNTATVKFRQIYESDRLSADSRKTLVLIKQGSGKWQIKQERAGS